jgi:hypothetical protein
MPPFATPGLDFRTNPVRENFLKGVFALEQFKPALFGSTGLTI